MAGKPWAHGHAAARRAGRACIAWHRQPCAVPCLPCIAGRIRRLYRGCNRMLGSRPYEATSIGSVNGGCVKHRMRKSGVMPRRGARHVFDCHKVFFPQNEETRFGACLGGFPCLFLTHTVIALFRCRKMPIFAECCRLLPNVAEFLLWISPFARNRPKTRAFLSPIAPERAEFETRSAGCRKAG